MKLSTMVREARPARFESAGYPIQYNLFLYVGL
jgi:hypothetical protein